MSSAVAYAICVILMAVWDVLHSDNSIHLYFGFWGWESSRCLYVLPDHRRPCDLLHLMSTMLFITHTTS